MNNDNWISPLDPWKQAGKSDVPVLVGSVGVDSASITISDIGGGPKIFTLKGDGAFPIFARKVDGRFCLVVDMELSAYGKEVFHDDPEDRPPKVDGEINRKCIHCGERIVSSMGCDAYEQFTCSNGHIVRYNRRRFTNYVYLESPNETHQA